MTTFFIIPGKAIFTNPDTGQPYAYGELFKQPQLAEFLRNISTHDMDYFYKGSFAKRFTETILSQKGTISEQDLADYEVKNRYYVMVPRHHRKPIGTPGY